MYKKGYPSQCIATEQQILCNTININRRTDILLYQKDHNQIHPLMLIECKAEKPNQEAIFQLIGYNNYLKARYIALGWKESFIYLDLHRNVPNWIRGIPKYSDLVSIQ